MFIKDRCVISVKQETPPFWWGFLFGKRLRIAKLRHAPTDSFAILLVAAFVHLRSQFLDHLLLAVIPAVVTANIVTIAVVMLIVPAVAALTVTVAAVLVKK